MVTELFKDKKAPYICTPLVGKSREALIHELKMILPKKPDLIEWRADFYEEIADTHSVLLTAKAIAEVTELPFLFTIRSEKEGGERIPLTEKGVVDLLCEICRNSDVDLIDFEVSNEPAYIQTLRKIATENGKKLILSYHNFEYTPHHTEIMKRLIMAEVYGADFAKAAVMPKNKEDVLRLLALTKEMDDRMQIPIITMSMGSLGALSRVNGWMYGSVMTFGVGGQSSAPGQIPIGKLKQLIDLTQETLVDW